MGIRRLGRDDRGNVVSNSLTASATANRGASGTAIIAWRFVQRWFCSEPRVKDRPSCCEPTVRVERDAPGEVGGPCSRSRGSCGQRMGPVPQPVQRPRSRARSLLWRRAPSRMPAGRSPPPSREVGGAVDHRRATESFHAPTPLRHQLPRGGRLPGRCSCARTDSKRRDGSWTTSEAMLSWRSPTSISNLRAGLLLSLWTPRRTLAVSSGSSPKAALP